jgi:hypothetical protein
MVRARSVLPLVASFVLACSSSPGGPTNAAGGAVVVDTGGDAGAAQQAADVAFADVYSPRCTSDGSRPRLLVTGFGHFEDITFNASGEMIARLVPGVVYPPPPAPATQGAVEDPATQTSVAVARISLPGVGDVDACGMILPVDWDLAAILIAKEIDSFLPQFVLMNGVADPTQPLWLELGSVNEAEPSPDASQNLTPQGFNAPLIPGLDTSDFARPLLASWSAIQGAAAGAITAQADVSEGGATFSTVMSGALYAGFPRSTNTYLCNNVTYVVNYLMDHPGTAEQLIVSSTTGQGASVAIQHDVRVAPREFLHWPSTLTGAWLDAGASVLAAVAGAELAAIASGNAPTRGDESMADPNLQADE